MAVSLARPDRYKIGVAQQTSLTDTTLLAAEELIAPNACDVSSVYRSEVDDDTHTDDGLQRPSVAGTWHDNAQPTLSVPVEGSRDTSGATAPDPTAFARLLAGAVQTTPVYRAGSGTTSLIGTNLVLTDVAKDMGPGGVSIVHIEDGDGALHAIPYMGTSTASEQTILMDFAGGTMAVGAETVMPDVHLPWRAAWDSLPVPLQVTAYSTQSHKSRRLSGCVASMSVGDVGPNDIPHVEFQLRASTAEREIAPIADLAPYWAPQVFRCSEMRLGVYGNVDAPRIPGRMSWSTHGYTPIQNPNTCGVDNWIRESGLGEITVTLPLGVTPDDLGATATTWSDAWEDADIFHLLVSYGQRRRGSIFSLYCEQLILRRPEDTEIDEVMGRTLHFRPSRNTVLSLG